VPFSVEFYRITYSPPLDAFIDADEDDKPVDQKEYRSMIGSLLYLTVTRIDNSARLLKFLMFSSLLTSSL
jgi:hypothetical protein